MSEAWNLALDCYVHACSGHLCPLLLAVRPHWSCAVCSAPCPVGIPVAYTEGNLGSGDMSGRGFQ